MLEDALQVADGWAQTGRGGRTPRKERQQRKDRVTKWIKNTRGTIRCKIKWVSLTRQVQPGQRAAGVLNTFQSGSGKGDSHVSPDFVTCAERVGKSVVFSTVLICKETFPCRLNRAGVAVQAAFCIEK